MCVYGRYAPANLQDRSTLQRYCAALYVKREVFFIQFKKCVNSFQDDLFKGLMK